jgi:molybdopterin molybdotransferase
MKEDPLITVEQATSVVLSAIKDYGSERIPLSDAQGRITAQSVLADRDFPPFDRVTMDGIAIAYDAYDKGLKRFPVLQMQAAGEPPVQLIDPGSAVEIMTGASLPIGTDTVIRYEDLIQKGDEVELSVPIKRGANVHGKGEDRKKGDVLICKHQLIQGPEMAVLATVGVGAVEVLKLPATVFVSSGDELVGVNETPLPHQIRRSNEYAVLSQLKNWGINADVIHLPDDPDVIEQQLAIIDEKYDLAIITGGVSKGKKDYFPEKLQLLGVNKSFHRVAQRPGKPFWFGTSERTVWFALPGNPVSAFMCTVRYVVPWLKKCLYQEPMTSYTATLNEDFSFAKPLQYFLQVNLRTDDANLHAIPTPGNGSGDFANLMLATGFLELPAESTNFPKGAQYSYWPFKPFLL